MCGLILGLLIATIVFNQMAYRIAGKRLNDEERAIDVFTEPGFSIFILPWQKKRLWEMVAGYSYANKVYIGIIREVTLSDRFNRKKRQAWRYLRPRLTETDRVELLKHEYTPLEVVEDILDSWETPEYTSILETIGDQGVPTPTKISFYNKFKHLFGESERAGLFKDFHVGWILPEIAEDIIENWQNPEPKNLVDIICYILVPPSIKISIYNKFKPLFGESERVGILKRCDGCGQAPPEIVGDMIDNWENPEHKSLMTILCWSSSFSVKKPVYRRFKHLLTLDDKKWLLDRDDTPSEIKEDIASSL
ncbi:MAG: hypothetical protein PHS07_00885 [Patescibacteria group bacterium]|nr:hypothetical protein [Patescibacteria group bacterium]